MTEATLSPVVSTCTIDGTIPPGKVFIPASAEQLADLQRLQAVREPTEAELLLHEKMEANAAANAAPAKPARTRRAAAPTQTEGGEAGNGEGGEAGNGEAGNGEGGEAGETAGETDAIG